MNEAPRSKAKRLNCVVEISSSSLLIRPKSQCLPIPTVERSWTYPSLLPYVACLRSGLSVVKHPRSTTSKQSRRQEAETAQHYGIQLSASSARMGNPGVRIGLYLSDGQSY